MRYFLRNLLRNERGDILVHTAFVLVALLGFAALAMDVGYMATAKNQLQSAVDAAALAGASGLMYSNTEATSRAMYFASTNDCIRQSVQISDSDISFPSSGRIRVEANSNLSLFFGRVLGFSTAVISATAVAELSPLDGTGDMKPWAVPDFGWPLGTPVVLKSGVLGAPATDSGFFYPVDFPPLNQGTPVTGAQEYESNIINGSSMDIFIGDELQVEPGNMVGPTQQGVNELISMDPGAYWNGTMIANSAYPGYSSPRIAKVPLYDPNLAPDSGRNSLTVIGLGAFFIMGIQGRDVTGIFLEITTNGNQGGGNTYLYGVRLVE